MSHNPVRWWKSIHWFAWVTIVVGPALAVAAALRAPLTWDGSYYLFAMLDSHEPFIAQNRIADKFLHYPVVWALDLTGSEPLAEAIFHVLHVVTPLAALALSWWVVRTTAPALLIWPMLCIDLALLPGQINFISEGIKAEQLMWPLLLALLVGLPNRTIPMVAILVIAIYTLHPVSAPILAACGLASVVLGGFRRDDRWRLIPAGLILVGVGIYRFLGVSSGYEQSEMTWETQTRQWSNSATGLPMVALVASALIAISILSQPLIPGRFRRLLTPAQIGSTVIAVIALIFWASRPTNWWEGLEFRGPAFWISMVAAGGLFLHVIIAEIRKSQLIHVSKVLMLTLASGFALVIVVQSLSWNQVLNDLDDQMANTTQACIAREDTSNYPFTPLNLWTTNSLTLVMQNQQPDVISMRASDCHVANQTGDVYVSDSQRAYTPTNFDFSSLHQRLPEATVCTWQETTGWHQPEALIPDTWRWSDGAGSIDIVMPETGIVLLSGEFRTLDAPNTITVVINGVEIDSFDVTSLNSDSFVVMPIRLPEGTTTVSFVSKNEPAILEGDGRPIAISVWNLDVRPNDGSSPCLKLDPA